MDKKKHIIISIETKKTLTKFNPFVMKVLKNLEIGVYLNIIKDVDDRLRPAAY
jgi:hypothetical protein